MAKKRPPDDACSTDETSDESKSMTLASFMQSTNKRLGERTIATGLDAKRDPPRIPFGVFAVDFTTGGGLPLWGTTGLFGAECIAGSSFIQYSLWTVDGKRVNCKGGTVRRLFERFNGIAPLEGNGKGKNNCGMLTSAVFTAPSINDDGCVFQNRITGVYCSGVKKCYRVKTSLGFSLIASDRHAFFTGCGYTELRDLKVGSVVYVHNKTPFTGRQLPGRRAYAFVKHHPVAGRKRIGNHTYFRLKMSRAVVEARMNQLPIDAFLAMLNRGDLDGLKFLPRHVHIHHVDKNPLNDCPSNLAVVESSAHNRQHALENHNKLRFVAVPDVVESIEYAGEVDTFDVAMEDPHNNFIANGIVVHNSGGKTTLALNVVGSVASLCWKCFHVAEECTCSCSPLRMRTFWADAEGTLDPKWAECVGAKPEDYYYCLAEYGEMYVNLAEKALRADDCGLVVVDSLAALTPAAMFEADAEDQFIGTQARMITRAVQRLKQRLVRERRREHPCCLLFTNQIRTKIGVMYGNPETMPGGHALFHEFSLLLRVVKKVLDKKADARYIGGKDGEKDVASRHSFSIRKEKLLTLASSGEFVRLKQAVDGLPKGVVDDFATVAKYAKHYGILKQEGKVWVCRDRNSTKLLDLVDIWKNDASEYRALKSEIIQTAKQIIGGEYHAE